MSRINRLSINKIKPRQFLLSAVMAIVSTPVLAAWEALPDVAPAPESNPTTESKVTLGKMLFMDP